MKSWEVASLACLRWDRVGVRERLLGKGERSRERVTRWRGEGLTLSWKQAHHLPGDPSYSFHVLLIPEDETCLAVSETLHAILLNVPWKR
jgi:hypothetical protein